MFMRKGIARLEQTGEFLLVQASQVDVVELPAEPFVVGGRRSTPSLGKFFCRYSRTSHGGHGHAPRPGTAVGRACGP